MYEIWIPIFYFTLSNSMNKKIGRIKVIVIKNALIIFIKNKHNMVLS